MFDCECGHSEYNHSTCSALNCNMNAWALNSINVPQILVLSSFVYKMRNENDRF